MEDVLKGILGLAFWSTVGLAPVLLGLFLATAARSLGRASIAAPVSAVIGFIVGGVVGWAIVPAAWTASFRVTVDAAGNAAQYGHAFERTAERALMYPLFAGELGAITLGVVALFVVSRPGSSSASTSRRRRRS